MSEPIGDARLNTVVRSAIRQAEKAAGGDDRAFLDMLRRYAPTQAAGSGGGARSISLDRSRTRRGARLDEDPRYLANVRALAHRTLSNARILGGSAVRGSEFDDCVAVGDDETWGCTGTLIAPDVVLTAGHCEALHTRVFVGNDVRKRGRIFRIRRHIRHPRFTERYRNDVMLLILDNKIPGVKPRPIAAAALIDAATDGRVVGFGTTDVEGTRGYGIKRQTDVPVVSHACRGRVKSKSDATVYGCHAGLEIVAGKALLLRDTCKGDSGGPFFLADARGRWFLAGVTSRGTDLAETMCGDGGCYVRADQYEDWIESETKKARRR
jgi:secreted trypsin-like serine protease